MLCNINVDDYDALAIPGGNYTFGYFEEAYDERFLNLINEFNKQNKVIASVCVGALPIGKSGALKGRTGTTYHLLNGYRQDQLAEFGVNVINKPIVVDKNIITLYCPQTAPEVAFILLNKLIGTEKTNKIKNGMSFQ